MENEMTREELIRVIGGAIRVAEFGQMTGHEQASNRLVSVRAEVTGPIAAAIVAKYLESIPPGTLTQALRIPPKSI
jgi:hypothetical protein